MPCRVLYIPLCFYFNHIRYCDRRNDSVLYIPLCLYSNIDHLYAAVHTLSFTFHYVSILMQSEQQQSEPTCLYIPLCLYFNIPLFVFVADVIQLYIPLCLYFNTTMLQQ